MYLIFIFGYIYVFVGIVILYIEFVVLCVMLIKNLIKMKI